MNDTHGIVVGTLIAGLPIELVAGSTSTVVHDVAEDSRDVTPGCLFVARPGTRADGARFIDDAVARGAVAVLSKPAVRPTASGGGALTLLAAPDPAAVLGALAQRFHGDPGRGMRLVGVTGTNGKTTVCHLIHQTLNHAGVRCGLIGTVQIDDGAAVRPAAMTTPGAIELGRMLAGMRDNGCRAAVLEISSHALHQGRTNGVPIEVGIFTNLTGDHLDYHGTPDDYAAAKATLFEQLPEPGRAVVNIDDPASQRMIGGCRAAVMTVSLRNARATCFATIGRQTIESAEAVFNGPWGALELTLRLTGRHNVLNALSAAAACWALSLDTAALREGLSRCTAPPGRLEPVTACGDPFSVLVDYAHTDDALANVLRTLRPLVPGGGRLRVVFGCGGDRDRTKRPRMAQVAAEIADELIITSDNPRQEDPDSIIQEILAGVPDGRRGDTVTLPCRREAIENAVQRCGRGDVVLIAGKGHEPYQIVGTEKRPFDDRRVAAEALARRHAGSRP